MDLGISFYILLGKLVSKFTKFSGSGGTALPGLVVSNLNPNLIKHFSKQVKKSSVLITGTNGKTTISRTLGSILAANKMSFIHNRAGSNLLRGIMSAFLEQSDMKGKISQDYGVFEVDEFVLPKALEKIKSSVVVINNLFRDQLDRYGEIDTVWSRWQNSLNQLDRETFLILNADDPNVAYLGKNTRAKVLYFGIEDRSAGSAVVPDILDAQKCQKCSSELDFEAFYASHMGIYKCSKCALARPTPHVSAKNIKLKGIDRVSFELNMGENVVSLDVPLGGIFNIYNVLAGVTAAASLGLDLGKITSGLGHLQPAFGRGEKLSLRGKSIYIALVKNPTGFNEVIKLLSNDRAKKDLLILINDLIADGKDVSWLWDVDFEKLRKVSKSVSVSGIRGADMALRLKYAHFPPQEITTIENDISKALEISLGKIKEGETLYILATYTAMLGLRKTLESYGVAKFSDD